MEPDSLEPIIDEAVALVSRRLGGMEVRRRCCEPPGGKDAAGLSVRVQGDYAMTLCMLADPPLLRAVTAHMARGEPEAAELEYAAEFFNILSGRIISCFNHRRGLSARFGIPRLLVGSPPAAEDAQRELCYDCGCGVMRLYYTPPRFEADRAD